MTYVIYESFIGFGIWALTLREEHRLRVLRGTFGSPWEEVAGGWRGRHKLYSLYFSQSRPSIRRLNEVREREPGMSETYTGQET
jgi:hypothetical protein